MARVKSLCASLGSESLRLVRPRRNHASPHLTSLFKARRYIMDASLNFDRLKYLFPLSTYLIASARGSVEQPVRTTTPVITSRHAWFPSHANLTIATSARHPGVFS